MNRLYVIVFTVALGCGTTIAHGAPSLTERIAALLLAQPRHSTDAEEADVNREARLRGVASAVSAASLQATCQGAWKTSECRPLWRGRRLELVAAVLAVGTLESHWARYTAHPDLCADGPRSARCDAGRARTYWQLWRSAAPAVWESEPGSDAELRAAAWAATKLLAGGYAFCQRQTSGDPWAAAFSLYAGRGCREWPGAPRRVVEMGRAITLLEHGIPWMAGPTSR